MVQGVGTEIIRPHDHPRCCRLLRLEFRVLELLVREFDRLGEFGTPFEFRVIFVQIVILGLDTPPDGDC